MPPTLASQLSATKTRGLHVGDRPSVTPQGVAWQHRTGAACARSPGALSSPRPSSAMGASFAVTANRYGEPIRQPTVSPRTPFAMRQLGYQRLVGQASRLSVVEPVCQPRLLHSARASQGLADQLGQDDMWPVSFMGRNRMYTAHPRAPKTAGLDFWQ